MKTKHFDTPFHQIAITTNEEGRISIVVKEGQYPLGETVVDVEIPSQEGEFKDAFTPTVKVAEDFEVEKIE